MSSSQFRFRTAVSAKLASACLLVGCCAWIAGCGVQAYEQRLSDSNEFFEHQNRLNRVLAPAPWVAPDGFEVSLRVPANYALIQPPPAAEGESAEPPADPRQPTYLGVTELEGLLGAWKAAVPTADNKQAFVFLYVLGNHQRWLDSAPGKPGAPPGEFLQDLESLLQLQLGITLADSGQSASQANAKSREFIPRVERFVRRKEFTSMRLVPSEGALQQLGLPELEMYVYEYQAGSVQVAVLLVAPRAIRASPDANLRVALETMHVGDQAPRRAAPGDSSAAPRATGF